MIRPTISQLRMEHIPGLHQLFQACQMDYATTWEFNPELTLVALHHDEVVGMIAGWDSGQPYAWVDSLLVLPKYKGQGIGAWLCMAIEGVLVNRGIKCIRAVPESEEVVEGLQRSGFHSRLY